MKQTLRTATLAALLLFVVVVRGRGAEAPAAQVAPSPTALPLSPAALAVSPDGRELYVACATAARVLVLDTQSRHVLRTLQVPESPQGLALSPGGDTLYVTCAAPQSTFCIADAARGEVTTRFPIGHTALSPVVSPDGGTVYVAHRFEDEVAFIDPAAKRITRRVPVPREPVSLALTPDGSRLFVANHLQAGRADAEVVAASISVIDTRSGEVCRTIDLPNGSTLVRDVRVSPDGRHVVIAHQLSRFHLPTTQLERGWVNTSALTVIDTGRLERVNTVLLDTLDAGAANPWSVAWSPDGQQVLVSHAGTHELSVIEFPALRQRLEQIATPDAARALDSSAASRSAADVPNDLSFLVGIRKRLRLASGDNGPRAVVMAGSRAWLANYFSDTLTAFDLAADHPTPVSLPLGPCATPSPERLGEQHFNDATLCFQGWQSCASCHSHDARVDSLNWDNLNDGIGNPKSGKSLLLAHVTPPSMWLGVRSNSQVAVRAGIRNSLFTVQPPEVAAAMDAYLASLKPIPSPRLLEGRLSASAERGKALFLSDAVGCAECHRGAFYTDLKFHDVGTLGKYDRTTDRFDTPTLVEVWRSGPFLHDGRAASIREVLTSCNPDDRHGATRHLTPSQIDDLTEFILSL